MLGLTSKKKAPALETLETAEIRVGRLPKEPLAALQELAALMDLLFSGSRIAAGQAYPIADLLDRTGRPHFRKIAQEYVLGHKQLTRFQNDRAWNTVTIYLAQLAKVYRYCLAQYEVGARGARTFGRMLPTIAARTMRACAGRMKWYDLRYVPIELDQWQELAAVYLLAESAGFARENLSLYRKAAQDSSVEQEFLRATMLAVASPGSMLPEQIEVAERLVAHCAPHFLIGTRPTESMRYFIDMYSDAGPHRMPLSGRIPVTARAFGAGNAIGELHRIMERFDAGRLTRAELGLSQEFDLELIRAAGRHLLRYWDPPLPDRRSPRQQEAARISVVYDFDEVTAKVGGSRAAIALRRGAGNLGDREPQSARAARPRPQPPGAVDHSRKPGRVPSARGLAVERGRGAALDAQARRDTRGRGGDAGARRVRRHRAASHRSQRQVTGAGRSIGAVAGYLRSERRGHAAVAARHVLGHPASGNARL